jgi:predicted esterase
MPLNGGAPAFLLPDPASPYLPIESWPPRWAPPGEPPGVLQSLSLPAGRLGIWRVTDNTHPEIDLQGAGDHAADARALLQRWPDLSGPVRFIREGPGAALVGDFTFRPPSKIPPAAVYRYVTGQPDQGDAILIQRTWFSIHEPAGDARGTVVLMPGLLGTPEGLLDAFTSSLLQRDWLVVRMLCQPSRFTQTTAVHIPDDENPGDAGPRLARLLTDGVAEAAYAVDAVCARLELQRPDLAARPRVAIGMSGGALILPAVVARNPDRYHAAILIAGGADLFTILDRSNYTRMIDGGRIDWDSPPSPRRRRDFADAYLANAPLDPFHAAAVLRDKKILLYHASLDQAVPAATGDLLWERLDRPERRTFPVGHELLFLGMTTEVPAVMDWLQAAFPHGRGP